MFYNSRQDDQCSRQQKPKSQPSKLKFLLGRHLATNSFGLGRLFYKSSRQLQNFRCYGDQNGRNLEGCLCVVLIYY